MQAHDWTVTFAGVVVARHLTDAIAIHIVQRNVVQLTNPIHAASQLLQHAGDLDMGLIAKRRVVALDCDRDLHCLSSPLLKPAADQPLADAVIICSLFNRTIGPYEHNSP
jgi:hypothetical protein